MNASLNARNLKKRPQRKKLKKTLRKSSNALKTNANKPKRKSATVLTKSVKKLSA
jgi:hypothetical protein